MKFLKSIREKKGLSQRNVADSLGVEINTVWRWEAGRATPSVETGKQIADFLGVSVDELLNGPTEDVWELRLIFDKEGKGVMDLTQNATSSATLEVGEHAMGVTLSGSFELWRDDAKLEDLIEQLRRKREVGLKARTEGWA